MAFENLASHSSQILLAILKGNLQKVVKKMSQICQTKKKKLSQVATVRRASP